MLARSTIALALVLVGAPAVAVGACGPGCEVFSAGDRVAGFRFVPAVAVVESGATLRWSALDGTGHTATESASDCFHGTFGPNRPLVATFVVSEGRLLAATGAGFEPCDAATPLADGGFLLPYECLLHSNMNADLIVR